MQGVLKQVIGLADERKIENRKGVTWKNFVITRKVHGVSDGFLRTHPGKPFSSTNFQGAVAEL
jgi:hypothetical protein